MPATAKLYETDPYVQTFTATVLVCTPAGEQFAVQLDRTAFYPEAAASPAIPVRWAPPFVTDVQEHGGVITHTVSAALPVGRRWKAALIGRAAATIWSSTPVNTF